MLVCYHCNKQYKKAEKADPKLILHHMGKIFIIYPNEIKFKNLEGNWFFKSFYHWEIMGSLSGFREVTETSSADALEMACRHSV